MARFLHTVWPIAGHLHANLGVANGLRRRGHEVAFYTGRRAQRDVEGDGFKCYPFQQLNESRVDDLLRNIDGATSPLDKVTKVGRWWREWVVGTIPDQVADIEAILDDWRPDVIVCDLAMWAPFLVLYEKRKIPVAMLSYLAACLLPGRDAPVLGMSMPRPHTWIEGLKTNVIKAALGVASQQIPRAANAVRQSYGLPALTVPVTTYSGQMPLYLMASIPEFDYERHDLPPSVHYVGPCVWDRPQTEPPPEFLTRLPRDRPWVYVTDGTMHFRPSVVVRAVLEAVGDLPIQIIATTGKGRTAGELGIPMVPPNTFVAEWVPHTDLFPMLDLVISTGGSGTTMKALMNGVPTISVPMAWDQGENAWRVQEAGAGLRLSVAECTPGRMRDAVQRVLYEPAFRQNAKRLAAHFAGYPGADRAAELLEVLALRRGAPA